MQRSLKKIAGVSKAEVNGEKAEAVVTFDDAEAKVETLTKAVTDGGYPATLKTK